MLYSLENIERIKTNENLYDMVYPMFNDNVKLELKSYKVREEREMRMDLICMDIYGNVNFIDELMHINGIIDPYSVKKDDIIVYPDSSQIGSMRKKYEGNREDLEQESNQKNGFEQQLTTSSPNSSYKQIVVDKNNSEIIITNKLR